jgi:hypothetical protein
LIEETFTDANRQLLMAHEILTRISGELCDLIGLLKNEGAGTDTFVSLGMAIGDVHTVKALIGRDIDRAMGRG